MTKIKDLMKHKVNSKDLTWIQLDGCSEAKTAGQLW